MGRQRVALALRRPDLRDHREHVSHRLGSPFRPRRRRAASRLCYAITGHFGRAARPARARYGADSRSARVRIMGRSPAEYYTRLLQEVLR